MIDLRPPKGEIEMNRPQSELPSITITTDDERRLNALANLNATRFPRVTHFLAGELGRANVVPDRPGLDGVVRMGSQVKYRDETTGRVREVTLVYPEEAAISQNRISVFAPVGVALIGLSVGQTIEFQTPIRERRSLTVLSVSS
jgi:regulator of nucleoside diphosphate kinase